MKFPVNLALDNFSFLGLQKKKKKRTSKENAEEKKQKEITFSLMLFKAACKNQRLIDEVVWDLYIFWRGGTNKLCTMWDGCDLYPKRI